MMKFDSAVIKRNKYMISKTVLTPLLALVMLLGACGGSSSETLTSPPITVVTPPVVVTPAVNVNITNPTLKTFDNTPVTDVNNMTLVWSEEFNDTQLDPETWYFESGNGSQYGLTDWGNNELQWYLEDSATIDNGILIITAKQESSNSKNYTSARLHTRDRVAVRYGRIEARMKLPAGKGMWPAFWLLPQSNAYGTWASSGEIDIMEAVNLGVNDDYKIHGTLHYGDEWPNNVYTGMEKSVSIDNTLDFHEYALEWDVSEMRWYVDGVLFATQNDWFTTQAPFPAPFDETFYILLNLAVGGDWPGSPDTSTIFPQTLEVDYLRVYEGN